jgi:hypothetical protein
MTDALGGATRTASAPNGTWKVYQLGNEYTGVDIVINGAPGSARFDQYTGSYSVNPQGAATGGTVSVAITGVDGNKYDYDFSQLPSGLYFKGDAVTFTATGEGADSYTYAWSGTHDGAQISGTGATLTIPSVSGTIDLICTITGNNASTGTTPTITTITLPYGAAQTTTVTTAKPVTAMRTPLTKIYLITGKPFTPPVCAYSVNAVTKKAETTAKLTWKSSKPKVAAVNPSTGKITPKNPGKTTITATALNGKKLTIKVTVVNKAVKLKRLTLVKPPKSLKTGKTATLKVKTIPENATNIKVAFESSKPKILKVDKAGKLTALKKGKAKITVKIGNREYVRAIIVK